MSAQPSYDAVAAEYAARLADELDGKPFDRALLDRFAERVRGAAEPVGDVGCGPGHVARYLHERGVDVVGVDLSGGMVNEARRLNPGLAFVQGDMRWLPVPDGAWGGLVAFYSLIHLTPAEAAIALQDWRRVLRPGAPVVIAFHIGAETVHFDEWWGHAVDVDFHFFQPDAVAAWLVGAGFVVEEVLERDPYATDVEHQSRRCYVVARQPDAA